MPESKLRREKLYHLLCSYILTASCEIGWYQYGDECFLFLIGELPFDLANEQCQQLNAYLTSIVNDEEKQFIVDVWNQLDIEDKPDSW